MVEMKKPAEAGLWWCGDAVSLLRGFQHRQHRLLAGRGEYGQRVVAAYCLIVQTRLAQINKQLGTPFWPNLSWLRIKYGKQRLPKFMPSPIICQGCVSISDMGRDIL